MHIISGTNELVHAVFQASEWMTKKKYVLENKMNDSEAAALTEAIEPDDRVSGRCLCWAKEKKNSLPSCLDLAAIRNKGSIKRSQENGFGCSTNMEINQFDSSTKWQLFRSAFMSVTLNG